MIKPYIPERASASSPPRLLQTMARSAIAIGRSIGGGDAIDVVHRNWPYDKATLDWLERGTVTPTTTATSGVPTSTALADFLPLLGPSSACGGLFSRALRLNFASASAITIPEVTLSAAGVAFVAQGSPFPIMQLAFSPAALAVKKLGLGVVLTRELYEGSNAETVISRVIAENLTLGVDALLFDNVDVDTTRPAGLLHGVSVTGATAGGGLAAMISDLANLAAIVAPLGQQLIFIASPKQAVTIQLRKTAALPYPVLSSAALADRTVACINVSALVVAGDEAPRFEISKQATVVLQDTNPEALLGSPSRSTWQTDSISLRLIQSLDWSTRASGAVAYTTNVTW